MRRRVLIAATGAAVAGSVVGRLAAASAATTPAAPGTGSAPATGLAAAATTWQPRWAPEATVDGLLAFEGIEDDRANSHVAGQPHILVEGNNFRFNMHMVDRDTMTDRQRQEVKGMHVGEADIIVLAGETWRWTWSMFIPGTLKATTSFTHIMQMKMPGTDSLPIITQSLQRVSGTPRIQLHAINNNVIVGQTNLAPLQNKWIDVEFEMTIGDGTKGAVRWALHDGATTIIDVTKTGIDTFLGDRVRPKWGIYRSLGDTSGSLQDTYLLLTKLRAYKAAAAAAPVRYEAENGRYVGTVDSNHAGFSGTGFVNTDNAVGAYTEWTVNAAEAGAANLAFHYANGTTTSRPMSLTVNGTTVAPSLAFGPTANWDTWADTTITASLGAGTNTVRLTATTVNGGPNLDYLEVSQGGSVQPPPPQPAVYEAEYAAITHGAIESNHKWYYGSGFVNPDNVAGSAVQFTVDSPAAQSTMLTIRYANGTTTDRPMDIAVNGTTVRKGQSFPGTATWDSWELLIMPVTLNAGSNTITLTATTANGGPNLDRILIGAVS
jgi:Carbohydrate binding module (family 35)/Carbohydrate binding module (family 6)